jgi:holo-[acyl-carrier protein] synthase
MRDTSPSRGTPGSPPSVIGVGVDIIEIERVRLAADRGGERFIRRVFTDAEAAYCLGRRYPARHLAARFAAKESVIKALRVPPGVGWLWRDIEVVRGGGPPSIRLSGRALERARALGVAASHLSISHSDTHAVAMVVLT